MNPEGIFQRLNWELNTYTNFNVIREPEKLFDAIVNGNDGKDYPREYLLNFCKLYKDIKPDLPRV